MADNGNVVQLRRRPGAGAIRTRDDQDGEEEEEEQTVSEQPTASSSDQTRSERANVEPAATPARPATPGTPATPIRQVTAGAWTTAYEPTPLDTLLDLILPALVILYVYLCPFTKVEESFNMQAIHDLLYHGPLNLKKFDHLEFPGVVPRTFLGAIAISIFSFPYKSMVDDKLTMQMVVRTLLGMFICYSLIRFRNAASRIMGAETGRWFVVVTAVQFHVLFWASRTLPNIFAFGLVNLALAEWFSGRPGYRRMVWLFAFTAAVFRSEVLLFAVPVIAGKWIWTRSLAFGELRTAIIHGLLASFAGIALSMAVDSYFWRQPFMWPEFEVFKFNGIENKSIKWGVHPWHYYFTNSMPRITASALPMALGSALFDQRTRYMLLPVLIFLAVYSYLIPHKEWRFVIYVVPLINIAAARWLSMTRTGSGDTLPLPPSQPRPTPTLLGRTLFLLSLIFLTFNALATAFQVQISSYNYPGGQALLELHKLEQDRGTPVFVHIDSYAAMNGITRFLELRPDWKYSKYEGYQSVQDFYKAGYTHLLTSEPQIQPEQIWSSVYTQEGYGGLHSMLDPEEIGLKKAIEKKDWKLVDWKKVREELWRNVVMAWDKKNPLILLPFDVALDELVWILRRDR